MAKSDIPIFDDLVKTLPPTADELLSEKMKPRGVKVNKAELKAGDDNVEVTLCPTCGNSTLFIKTETK